MFFTPEMLTGKKDGAMLLNDVHLSSLRVFVIDKAHTKSMVSLSITVCVCLYV